MNRSFSFGPHIIGEQAPALIIAEIGNNHNGCLSLAKKLVDQAIGAGADCVKFQMRNLQRLYINGGNSNDSREDLGSQYILDVLCQSHLSKAEMFELFDYCHDNGIMPLCTPWDTDALEDLSEYGMKAFKIASADVSNPLLISAVCATGKPVLLSTGMSCEEEIIDAVALLKEAGAAYALLHCISTYPAPFKDINLSYLRRLQAIGDCPVGYSGHERGYAVAVAAVALGAKVIEKHFTLDKTMYGNDHKISLLPIEFKEMVSAIRQVEAAIGTGSKRRMSQGERMNRDCLAKSLIINRAVRPGDRITAEMVEVKSPGKGLQPNRLSDLLGTRIKRPMQPGEFFYTSDLHEGRIGARTYRFRRPWGTPVRFHDYQLLSEQSNMDFVEFHLSYKDMDADISTYFSDTLPLGLVVHSPDHFADDHLLNLASEDDRHRERSIRELQRVIDLTIHLAPFFEPSNRIPVIANVGGFTHTEHLPQMERRALYERVAESLDVLNIEGVEILPQTVPPFPWYRGGQLFCNLFVYPEEIVAFCERYGYRVCLDVSHSFLSVNNIGGSLCDFVELVAPVTGHLHIADASGVDGEGLQIGEGEVDFGCLSHQLSQLLPDVAFIPEIWQGHKNQGEGFWIALNRLEPLL